MSWSVDEKRQISFFHSYLFPTCIMHYIWHACALCYIVRLLPWERMDWPYLHILTPFTTFGVDATFTFYCKTRVFFFLSLFWERVKGMALYCHVDISILRIYSSWSGWLSTFWRNIFRSEREQSFRFWWVAWEPELEMKDIEISFVVYNNAWLYCSMII